MASQSIYDKGDQLLKAMTALNNVASSETSAQVRCSESLSVFAERDDLISVSGFFESMLALKPTKAEAVIDLITFCDDELTLSSLVHFATVEGIIPFQWSISTTANMIFLVDPLQLTQVVVDCLFANLIAISKDQAAIGVFLTELKKVVEQRQPKDTEIETILTILRKATYETKTEVPPVATAETKPWEIRKQTDGKEYFHNTTTKASVWDKPAALMSTSVVFVVQEKFPSLLILALWIQFNASTLVVLRMSEILREFDVKVGECVPQKLLACANLDADLLYWVKMIYACGCDGNVLAKCNKSF